jgi:hypothetical protein
MTKYVIKELLIFIVIKSLINQSIITEFSSCKKNFKKIFILIFYYIILFFIFFNTRCTFH